MATSYNPNDPAQQALLAGIAQGETGGGSNTQYLGTGGTDLSGASTDQYGFPQWAGVPTSSGLNSTAAGTYQFTQTTWDEVAAKYNLNFSNPQDQAAGAWYLAQQRYGASTGGDLETDLGTDATTGNFANVQSALTPTWTSLSGNGALPGGLSSYLQSDASQNENAFPATAATQAQTAAGASTATAGGSTSGSSSQSGWVAQIENWFERFGLIAAATIIGGLALWAILSRYTNVPGPKETAGAVAALAM